MRVCHAILLAAISFCIQRLSIAREASSRLRSSRARDEVAQVTMWQKGKIFAVERPRLWFNMGGDSGVIHSREQEHVQSRKSNGAVQVMMWQKGKIFEVDRPSSWFEGGNFDTGMSGVPQ